MKITILSGDILRQLIEESFSAITFLIIAE